MVGWVAPAQEPAITTAARASGARADASAKAAMAACANGRIRIGPPAAERSLTPGAHAGIFRGFRRTVVWTPPSGVRKLRWLGRAGDRRIARQIEDGRDRSHPGSPSPSGLPLSYAHATESPGTR